MSHPDDPSIAAIGRIDAIPRLLDVVCRSTGMGFAAVARVTETNWICCAARDEIAFGLKPGGELPLQTTICDEIRDCGQPVVIDEVATDPVFASHKTPALYGFQSYISFPIRRANGEFWGTLCAIDPRPNQLKRPEILEMFKLFCDLIAFHLEGAESMAAQQELMLREREVSELREQFIAVLGHDLRNPLAAIDGGLRLMAKTPLDERAVALTGMIRQSIARMTTLIDDVMDFARGRMGGGLSLVRKPAALGPVLAHVVEEMRIASPGRTIETEITLDRDVNCEPQRIGQLASNLLYNALTHGEPGGPVTLRAAIADDVFELSVANRGTPIPADALPRLFQPFSRDSVIPGRQGLGLGLYIAAEIARAHDGKLRVVSNADETRFTFTMPA